MKSAQKQLEAIAARSMEKAERVVKASIIQAGSTIEAMSPVDKGTFKLSWETGINAAETQGTGAISANLNSFEIGDSVYFTNKLPYAKRLEDGYSQQASRGMVKVTAANWDNVVLENIRRYR